MPRPPGLAQVDIDAEEIGRHYPVTVGVHADARETLRALREALATGEPALIEVRPGDARNEAGGSVKAAKGS